MTQFQFELACKIINLGAPVLATELCGSLNELVQSYNTVVKENEQLKAQLKEATSTTPSKEQPN